MTYQTILSCYVLFLQFIRKVFLIVSFLIFFFFFYQIMVINVFLEETRVILFPMSKDAMFNPVTLLSEARTWIPMPLFWSFYA